MEADYALQQYVFVEKLGEGGMGEVWRGKHAQLGSYVAIKFLKPEFAHDRALQERFLNEGKRQANLDHPNIIRAFDYISEGGRYFLVMQFVEGAALDRWIADSAGPLPIEQVLQVSYQILPALAYAHEKGIVHRDVKPSNIISTRDGRCYLTDFGIALVVGQQRVTRTGTVIGTVHYMSPEQIRQPLTIDHRTDIYAYGAVLFEMLTGVPPFDDDTGNDFLIKEAHVNTPPPAPSRLNAAISVPLERVVLRALAKHPKERFQTCDELLAALQSVNPNLHSWSRKDNSDTKPTPVRPKPKSRVPTLVFTAVAGLILAFGITFAYIRKGSQPVASPGAPTNRANIPQVILQPQVSSPPHPPSKAEPGIVQQNPGPTEHKSVAVKPPTATIAPRPKLSPPEVRFSGDHNLINPGQSVALRWSATRATQVEIDPGYPALASEGTVNATPVGKTEYTLIARGPGGITRMGFTVELRPPITASTSVSISGFTASPRFIAQGSSTYLTWNVTGAARVMIVPEVGVVGPSGSTAVKPSRTTKYTLVASASDGSSKAQQATVVVSGQ